ncbi:sigma factor-like helix-turn-helix DNA-binding protein [Peribacillus sp. SCS-37]|uniref:sigma factor-like helix-turn-helix DNA-binding protein n=1 Tax=Paraperibacillus esterisolvens TaxID=3115296 RepID=UPI003905F2FC
MLSEGTMDKPGRRDGWEDKMKELYGAVLKYSCFVSQNSWDGEDIAQSVLLKAWEHYRDMELITPALLNKMAYHCWIDLIRKRSRECLPGQLEDKEGQDFIPREITEESLGRLTPKQAAAFLLKEGFLYTSKEIAELTGINDTAVKAAILRARKRLGGSDEANPLTQNMWNEEENIRLMEQLRLALIKNDPAGLIHLLKRQQTFQPLPARKSAPKAALSMAA